MPTPQFVDVMTVYPQHCLITGGGNQNGQEPALDLGFDIDGYGRAYISAGGFERLAHLFGWVPQTALAELDANASNTMIDLMNENAELRGKLGAVPAVIERTLHGLHQLSVAAVGDLLALDDAHPVAGGDGDPADREEGAGGDADRAADESAGDAEAPAQ